MPVLRESAIDFPHNSITVDEVDAEKWYDYYNNKLAVKTVGTKRDYCFLKWRYMESPVLKYNFITVADRRGNYCGLAVLRIEKIVGGKKIGRILEFIAMTAVASIDLARAVVDFDRDVLMWDFYCLFDVTSYGLEVVGFRRMPEWLDAMVLPTRFQPIDYNCIKMNVAIYLEKHLWKQIKPLSDNQWYITRGDADQDRAN